MPTPPTGAYRALFQKAVNFVAANRHDLVPSGLFTEEEVTQLCFYRDLLKNPNWKLIDVTTIRHHPGGGDREVGFFTP